MRIRTANSLLLASLLIAASGTSVAEVPLKARAYQCQELRDLVTEKERVYLKGFLGSKSSVYSSASSCSELHEVAVKSAWRTSDVFSCVIGYRCLPRVDIDDRFGG